jgi:hypothetical protein
MKVNIGPYRDGIRVYKWEDKWLERNHGKRYYDVEEEDYTFTDKVVVKTVAGIQWALDKTINVFLNRKRKIDIRIDYYDVWSMDHTLSMIVHPMLLKLKEVKHGSPFVDDEDVPEHLRSTAAPELTQDQKDYGHTDALFHDRWAWVLDEMIYAFASNLDDDWDDQFETGVRDYLDIEEPHPKFGKVYSMKEGPNHTFKIDTEAMKAGWARRKNGMRLFGKYYNNLWD